MGDHAETAKGVLRGVGGAGNVKSLVHCMTRLRFVLADESLADTDAIRALPGVITTQSAGGQYQVAVGHKVADVRAAIEEIADFGGRDALAAVAERATPPSRNPLNQIIEMVSAVFTPILWALAGTGLLKAFLVASVTFGWLDAESSTHAVLNALSDAFIFFLPMALAITAARYFKASEFTSLAIAGALVHPGAAAMSGEPGLTFFGLPLTMVGYASSVVPIMVAVWLQSRMERLISPRLPAAVRMFATPMIVLLVLVPAVFLAIGPITTTASGAVANGIGWVFATVPWLGGAVMGGLWQVLVIFGLHWGTVPIVAVEIAESGKSVLAAPMFAAVLAQASAVAAVLVRSRNRELRALAAPATLSGFLAGITEPAIYGVNLPLKRPFAFGLVGGAVGGALIGLGHVSANAFVVPSGLSLPTLFGSGGAVMLAAGLAAAILIPFVCVVISHQDPGGQKDEAPAAKKPTSLAPETVLSPLSGELLPLSDIADAAFAGGALGLGVAIRPTSETVRAPFDGEVLTAFPTGHAVGLRRPDGAHVLIHVGRDTVQLGGRGFKLLVTAGQSVRAGDPLIQFDSAEIERAGHDLTTPVVVANSDEFKPLLVNEAGHVTAGDQLFVAAPARTASATS